MQMRGYDSSKDEKKKKDDQKDPDKPIERQPALAEDYDAKVAMRQLVALAKKLSKLKDSDDEGQTDVIVEMVVLYQSIPGPLRDIIDMKSTGIKLSTAIAFLNQKGMCHKNRAEKVATSIRDSYAGCGGNVDDLKG